MKFWKLLVIIVCMFLAGACAPKPAEVFPNGSYMTQEITGSGTADITMALNYGHFTMTSSDTGPLAEGSYQVDGDQVTFTEENTDLIKHSICGPEQTVYTYQWSIDPETKNLRFKKVDDSCSPRAGVAATTWKVVQASPTPSSRQINQAAEIFGIWTLTTHPHYKQAYWLLRPDGTFTFSPNRDGGKPSESGEYWFEEGKLFIKDDFCPTPGKYTVMKQGSAGGYALIIELVEDGCTAREGILTSAPEIWFGALP